MLADIDPSPIFALSLIPYLLFLHWVRQCSGISKLALLGFKLTLLFVFITIIAAIAANYFFSSDLVSVDTLHGGAELFLTISNATLVMGLWPSKKTVNNS